MSRKIWMIVALVSLVSMITIVGASTLMGGCSKLVETAAGATLPMKCHWTFAATAIVGIIGVVSSLLTLAGTTKEGRRFAGIVTLITGGVVILLATPLGIGLCGSADMHCHQTALIVWIAAGVSLVVSSVQMVKADPQAINKPKMKL